MEEESNKPDDYFRPHISLKKNEVLALVMAPSRELVIQIYEEIKKFEQVFEYGEDKNSIAMTYFIGGGKIEYDM